MKKAEVFEVTYHKYLEQIADIDFLSRAGILGARMIDGTLEIPFYGDHVSLFTLLMTVSTIMYTYMNNQMMGAQSNQLPGMKTMMYFMPIMFLGIFNSYASGLSYYYFLANIITFGQMFVFRYAINEDKLRAKIEANKKKPKKKKSGFQKRLEDAAKQRGLKS